MLDLASRVKKAREKRGMSQRDLCDLAGVSNAYVSLIERAADPADKKAIRNPGTTSLSRIADALRVPFDWLARGDGGEPDWDEQPARAKTGTRDA